jgi:hypothetical protein
VAKKYSHTVAATEPAGLGAEAPGGRAIGRAGTVRLVPVPSFRFVCVPAALEGTPANWARELLVDGEIALLADDGGFAAISDVAHSLDLASVPVVRTEQTADRQEQTVIAYAQALPLIWVAGSFSAQATSWARDRGPMTLLVQAAGPLLESERRRIDRFVATLGRQSE